MSMPIYNEASVVQLSYSRFTWRLLQKDIRESNSLQYFYEFGSYEPVCLGILDKDKDPGVNRRIYLQKIINAKKNTFYRKEC